MSETQALPVFAAPKPGYALPRQPPSRGFACVVVGGFEGGFGEGGLNAQHGVAVVGDAVLAAGRYIVRRRNAIKGL